MPELVINSRNNVFQPKNQVDTTFIDFSTRKRCKDSIRVGGFSDNNKLCLYEETIIGYVKHEEATSSRVCSLALNTKFESFSILYCLTLA